MKEIESKVSFLSSSQLNGQLFVEDFVGLSDSKQGLQAGLGSSTWDISLKLA